jgi:hypothetical protein
LNLWPKHFFPYVSKLFVHDMCLSKPWQKTAGFHVENFWHMICKVSCYNKMHRTVSAPVCACVYWWNETCFLCMYLASPYGLLVLTCLWSLVVKDIYWKLFRACPCQIMANTIPSDLLSQSQGTSDCYKWGGIRQDVQEAKRCQIEPRDIFRNHVIKSLVAESEMCAQQAPFIVPIVICLMSFNFDRTMVSYNLVIIHCNVYWHGAS